MRTAFPNLLSIMQAIPDEKAAVAYFRGVLWKNSEHCPYCGHDKIYHFEDGKTFKCAECRKRFSIRVGTIFEDSKIELSKWLYAIWMITSHKKGIASTQLARDIGVTQKSAWFMLHRLRHAARTQSFNRRLTGIVEADEAFFGGKEINKHADKRGKDQKVVVFGMLERQGEFRARPLESLRDARKEIIKQVDKRAFLMTDEWAGYRGLGKVFNRYTVNHSAGEYSRDRYVHINSIEGAWSLLKRQIYGIHHFVSPKHLRRYIDEAVWRYNRRGVKDFARMLEFIGRLDGRLTYKTLIAKA